MSTQSKWQRELAAGLLLALASGAACLGHTARAQDDPSDVWRLLNQQPGGPPAISPLPTEAQLKSQHAEKELFIHFTVNSFTGREWGDGKENPDVFNPAQLDCEQWVKLAKETGYHTICLTVKHHDGFCLWPSKHTDHSVKASAWRGGKGDVVREFADACQKHGVNISYYLSPWDRHDPRYGTVAYNEYFTNQLIELMTGYGPVKGFWFDGAVGSANEDITGKNLTPFAWADYYAVIRRYAPDACISMMGPDIGWVGNEGGVAADENWNFASAPLKTPSMVRRGKLPVAYLGHAYTQEDENQVKAGAQPGYKAIELLAYRPKEADTSILGGWFWRPGSNPKSPEALRDIYFASVGRGSILRLNLCPDNQGRIPDDQAAALRQLDRELKQIFATDFAAGKTATADKIWHGDARFAANNILDNRQDTYWAGESQQFTGSIEVDLGEPRPVNLIRLQEPIHMGQRVSAFKVECRVADGPWKDVCAGSTIGCKRLIRFPAVTARQFRLRILDARTTPLISGFGLYFNPFDQRTDSKAYNPKREKTGTKEEGSI